MESDYAEDGLTNMKTWCLMSFRLCCALGLFTLPSVLVHAHPSLNSPAQRVVSAGRVTIEVTGGEKDTPIENASVYLKYVEQHKITKDKQHELNVKTNREGVAHVPDAPLGRVLIQVIAEGWKTYGRWYDITDVKEPIKVHLDRPPKWY